MEGMIFSVVRNSFVDGPGIRTTVFFKGAIYAAGGVIIRKVRARRRKCFTTGGDVPDAASAGQCVRTRWRNAPFAALVRRHVLTERGVFADKKFPAMSF